MKEIRHWYIQKPIANNCPLDKQGAVFTEFMPTIVEQGCEWIKVFSADDIHLKIGMGLTRYVDVMTQLTAAQAEIAKWKDEYFNVSKFATDYENKLSAAAAENAELKDELSKHRPEYVTDALLTLNNVVVEKLKDKLTAANAQMEAMAEDLAWYGSRNNWKLDSSSDTKDVIAVSDLGCKSLNGENNFADYAIPSGGRRAREILAQYEQFKNELK